MSRFRTWLSLPEIQPPTPTDLDSVERACDTEGRWLGLAVVVHEHAGWTFFEDLTGMLGRKGHASAESWLALAGADDFVYAEYNDAIPFGGYAEVRGGVIACDVFDDPASPDLARSRGKPEGAAEPVTTWSGIASLVDEDVDWAYSPGFLWIFEPSP